MADIRVLHGNPTEAEIAAVVVALTPVTVEDLDVAGRPARQVAAWTAAALREGTGGARVHAPDELSRPSR